MGKRSKTSPARPQNKGPRSGESLPGADDIQALRRMVVDLVTGDDPAAALQAIDVLLKIIEGLRDRNNHLALKIAKLVRERYGRKSEKLDAHQLSLFLKSVSEEDAAPAEVTEAASEANAAAAKSHTEELRLKLEELRELKKAQGKKGRRGGRTPLPENLPQEIIRIPVSEKDRGCEACGDEKSPAGSRSSKVVEFVPASFRVIVYEREQVACRRCEAGMVTAPAANRPVEGGRPGPGLLAHLVVTKYHEHQPLHRITQSYQRLGVRIPASTLGQWVGVVAEYLRPLYDALKAMLLVSWVVGADDTGLKVLDRNSPNNILKGYLWAYVGYERGSPTRALFRYEPDRKGFRPRNFLEDRRGYIQGDGYSGLDALFAGNPPACVKVGCMMHARRYYKIALDSGDLRAAVALDLIQGLYTVEALATEGAATPEGRLALRQEHSRPLMERLEAWVRKQHGQVEPSSYLGKALTYSINQWASLEVFLNDGAIPIDNGEVERRIRPVALGRRNWLFAGSDAGAERAAIIYSLLACCKLAGVEPLAWLTDVLTRLCKGWPMRRLHELLPENWKPEEREVSPAAPDCGSVAHAA